MRSTGSYDVLASRHLQGEGHPSELDRLRHDLRALDAKVHEVRTKNAVLEVRLNFVEKLLNEERGQAWQMQLVFFVIAIGGAVAAILGR